MIFWDSIDTTGYRKVLVIPNITNSRNIEKDSFVDVIYNHIIALEAYGDYFWHIVLPKPVAKLNLENVKQHIVPFSGDMVHMRVTFPTKLIKILQEVDYDVIYSHLPDWYMVKRYTEKDIIGYTHWWEMKTSNAEDRKNRFRNIAAEIIGASQMKVCFLNTLDQKNRVLAEAREWFNDEVVSKLDNILRVWNLGVARDRIIDSPKDKENIIVFPHRAAAYKGYPKFIEMMKEYRERRQDFVVWVPQLQEKPSESWIDNKRVSKREYYDRLQICIAGVQMRQSNYGWSVSATDCMMNGTTVIFQESDCYREIDPGGIFFRYKRDLFKYLDRLLDDVTFRMSESERSIKRAHQLYEDEQKMIEELHKLLTETTCK